MDHPTHPKNTPAFNAKTEELVNEKPQRVGRERFFSKERFACRDCPDKFPPFYHVHPKVWAEAGMVTDGGWLCLSCLETRLGRRLKLTDFTSKLANTAILFGYGLAMRDVEASRRADAGCGGD